MPGSTPRAPGSSSHHGVSFVGAGLVSLALATVIHLDWHFARPAHHPLSLGLPWHWLVAVPSFALVAWYVVRAWPVHLTSASLAIIGSATLLAGVLEPAWEYLAGGAPFDWAFGAPRNLALLAFMTAGLLTYCVILAVAVHRRRSLIAG